MAYTFEVDSEQFQVRTSRSDQRVAVFREKDNGFVAAFMPAASERGKPLGGFWSDVQIETDPGLLKQLEPVVTDFLALNRPDFPGGSIPWRRAVSKEPEATAFERDVTNHTVWIRRMC